MTIAVWQCNFCGMRSDVQGKEHVFIVDGASAICEGCVTLCMERIVEHKTKQILPPPEPATDA